MRLLYEEGDTVLLKTWEELAVDYPVTLDMDGDEQIAILHEGSKIWGSDKDILGKYVTIYEKYADDYWVLESGGFSINDFMVKRIINRFLDPECFV